MPDLVTTLLAAFALVFVIEGFLYAALPDFVRKMMAHALTTQVGILRSGGLIAMAAGVVMLWLVLG